MCLLELCPDARHPTSGNACSFREILMNVNGIPFHTNIVQLMLRKNAYISVLNESYEGGAFLYYLEAWYIFWFVVKYDIQQGMSNRVHFLYLEQEKSLQLSLK